MPRPQIRPIGPMSPEKIKKFWSRVERIDEDSCWNWQGARDERGYGFFLVRKAGKGPTSPHVRRTHRIAFFLHYGFESEYLICHKCDNPPCCNPFHLFEGTDLDNTVDRRRKGRSNAARNPARKFGVENPVSKLNDQIVRKMRACYEKGDSMAAISRAFGVSTSNTESVVKRKTWTHIK